MKRNCQYTYNITLKPNDSDTRITYKKSGTVWAGSNIYWNGTKLTFDAAPVDPSNLTTQELTNMKKQGVFFLWGSLIGVSPNGAHARYDIESCSNHVGSHSLSLTTVTGYFKRERE